MNDVSAMNTNNQSVPPAFRSEGGDDAIDVRDIFLMFWRRRFMIVSIVMLGLALMFGGLTAIQERYTARAIILLGVNDRVAVLPKDIQLFSNNINFNSSVTLNEIEIIRSRQLVKLVIDRLDLMQDPYLNVSYFRALQEHAPELLTNNDDFKKFNINKNDLKKAPLSLFEQQKEDVVNKFLSNLRVRSIPGSDAIQIRFTSTDAERAALIANTVADIYIQQRLDAKFRATRKLTDWLDGRLLELREQVRLSEEAVAGYRSENGILEGTRTAVSVEQISQLNTQLVKAKTALAESQARLSQVRTLSQSSGNISTASEVLGSDLVKRLKLQQVEVQKRLTELRNRYGERHPQIIAAKEELTDVDSNINAEILKIKQNLQNEVEITKARVTALEQGLDDLKNFRNLENDKMVALNELEREAESNRLIFDRFLETYKKSDEQEDLQDAEARVISYAAVPRNPSYPDHMLFLSLAMALSLFLGILLAFVLEKLDNTFRSANQLERATGFSCYALIPSIGKMAQQKLVNYVIDNPSSTLAEAVRTLRAILNIRAARNGKKPKVITVTSSFPGEGKTTLSCWMARLAVKSGDRVLLIDADMRRPNVHRSLRIENDFSIVEFLTGQESLRKVINTNDQTGLHVIPAKSVPNSALDLISSDGMKTLIDGLRDDYDLIILDTPACLAVSDARILATMSDQTIYSVLWDRTPREFVLGGIKQFIDIGYKNIAFVLSNVDVRRHVSYGYGDGMPDYKEDKPKTKRA